jgi:hypothetical protein
MRAIAIVVAGLCFGGCWDSRFEWSISGQVHDSQSDAGLVACVVIRCPSGGFDSDDLDAEDVSVSSNPAGQFTISSQGAGPTLDCALVVQAQGHAASRTPISQVCTTVSAGRCKDGQATIALDPADGGPTGCF